MTPMIDVVFLLLIFFMTVSQISEINKERLQLPQLKGSEDQKPTVLTINVTRDGQVRAYGETVSIAGLVSLIDRELLRLGGDHRLLTIVVRTDRASQSRMTNEIVRALGKLGIIRIRIAVESSD